MAEVSTPVAAMLAERFKQLKVDRDASYSQSSVTEGRTYRTDEGLVQEIVSSTPSHVNANGETIRTVTRRRCVTSDGGSTGETDGVQPYSSHREASSSPTGSSASLARGSSYVMDAAHSVGLAGGSVGRNSYGLNNTPTGSTFSGRSPGSAPYQQYAGASLDRDDSSYASSSSRLMPGRYEAPSRPYGDTGGGGSYYSSSTMDRGRSRNVAFGGVDTRVVDTGGSSPVRVQAEYAPVKYVTRAQLRRMRKERKFQRQKSLQARIRSSSLPRYDDAWRGHQQQQQHMSYDNRSDAGYDGYGGHKVVTPMPHSGRVVDGSESPVRGQQWYESQPPSLYRDSNVIPSLVSPAPTTPSGYYSPAAGIRARSAGSVSRGYSAGRTRLVYDVDGVVQAFCALHRLPVPAEYPPLFRRSLEVIMQGCYLIKYPQDHGNPHERYLQLQIQPNSYDESPLVPFVTWRIHKDAVEIKERIPLVYITGFQPGDRQRGFERHRRSPGYIIGPFVGGNRPNLPTTYAFTVFFSSMGAGGTYTRALNLLALDEATYVAWKTAMTFFVRLVKPTDASEARPFAHHNTGVDSLAPDTPRSMASSARGVPPSSE